MKKQLLIVGSGSQARYVIDIVRRSRQYTLAGIADIENKKNIGNRVNGVPIVCLAADISKKFKPASCRLVIAYGDTTRKKELAQKFSAQGFSFASIVSPEALISATAEIGDGCIINPAAVVMPNAVIGDHVILHSRTVVEHDNQIGDYANLAPAVTLAGRVKVGKGAFIYTGAVVIPDVRIGDWAVVAAGAVVTKDVPSRGRVAGVPAKPMKSNRKKS